MRDSKLAIRTAYFNALDGNITLNGRVVPPLDRVPADQKAPYIKLSTQTSTEGIGGKKDCKLQETTILLDIVTAYDSSRGGKQDTDLIADQVLQILAPEDTADLPSLGNDFQLVNTQIESDFDIEEKNQTVYVYRRLIRFRNQVEQLV